MSLDACADLVARGDPDRFAATMAAPLAAREKLLPLFAMNIEVSRAPWASKEAMICEMRLQWWRDVIAAPTARAHDVAGPVHDLIQSAQLPLDVLDRMIAARIWDIYTDPFDDHAALIQYLDDTSGNLMWLSALALGANHAAQTAARDYGLALGIAGYLRAIPALEQRGRRPLVDGRAQAVRALAQLGLDAITRARAGRKTIGPAWPAILPCWSAPAILRQVVQDPALVASGLTGQSEFARRGSLALAAVMRRV